MVSSIVLLLGAAVAYGIFATVSGLSRNIAAAKRSGLPYYVIRKPRPGPSPSHHVTSRHVMQ